MKKLLLVLFFVSLAACVAFPEPQGEALPDAEGFKQALTSFYDAEQNKDWPTYWSLMSEPSQQLTTYENFFKNMRHALPLSSYRIVSITNHGPDSRIGDALKAQVEVVVERTTIEAANYYGVDQSTELWWYLDSKWVWFIRY